MSRIQVSSGKVFHKLLVECLSQGRAPTEEEIGIVAGEIWQSSHGCVTGQPWEDVARGSDAHLQMLRAAGAALGAHTRQLKAINDKRPRFESA